MQNSGKWGGMALGLACVACCAPLILPLVMGGAGLVGVVSSVGLGTVLCLLPVAGLGLALIWQRRRSSRAASCGSADQCRPDCKPGSAGV